MPSPWGVGSEADDALASLADVCVVGPPEGGPDLDYSDVSSREGVPALRAFPDLVGHLGSWFIGFAVVITACPWAWGADWIICRWYEPRMVRAPIPLLRHPAPDLRELGALEDGGELLALVGVEVHGEADEPLVAVGLNDPEALAYARHVGRVEPRVEKACSQCPRPAACSWR